MRAAEIAARLGLHRAGRDWRGTCPVCGYPTSFSVSTKEGRPVWWCASCQDRNGTAAAVKRARGGSSEWRPPSQHRTPSEVVLAAEKSGVVRHLGPLAGSSKHPGRTLSRQPRITQPRAVESAEVSAKRETPQRRVLAGHGRGRSSC
jgi:hypothetical protein